MAEIYVIASYYAHNTLGSQHAGLTTHLPLYTYHYSERVCIVEVVYHTLGIQSVSLAYEADMQLVVALKEWLFSS
jgi:hypothetical protein